MFIVQQCVTPVFEHDPAGLQDIGAVGDAEGLVDVLLDQQDGHALPVDLL